MKFKYLYLLVSFIVPVVLYFQTVSFGFTDFDDNRLIKDNADFLSETRNIREAFKTDAFITGTSHFYRPLQVLSYMSDIRIAGGINPRMFHLTNVLLFGLISCALFLLLSQFGIATGYVFPAALIFVVHPLFVSAVAWIPARGELLLALFTLVAFLTLEKYSKSGKSGYLVLHSIAFILALFSKETAVLLPLLFLLFFFIRSKKSFSIRKSLTLAAIYLLTGFTWFRIRLGAIGDLSASKEYVSNFGDEIIGVLPFIQNIRTIPAAFSRFLLPFDLDLIPSFSIFNDIAGTTLLIVFGILLVRNHRMSKSEKLLCGLWFLLMMLPPMFFKHKLIDYLDHRFLLPLVGILPAILMIFQLDSDRSRNYKYIIMFAVIISLSVYTYLRSRAYNDPLKFYSSAIRQNPSSPIAHNNFGAIFHNKGNYEKAIMEYTAAIRIYGDYLNAYNNRANACLLVKRYKDAINDYTMVISMDPDDEASYNNRGVAFLRNRQPADACRDFKTASELGSKPATENLKRFCK